MESGTRTDKFISNVGVIGVIIVVIFAVMVINSLTRESRETDADRSLAAARASATASADMISGCASDECRKHYWRLYNF